MAVKKNEPQTEQGIGFNLNVETTPVLYTDNVRMTTSPMGVVMSFGQTVDTTNQVKIVSRIGMSREHAQVFVNEMSKLLALTQGNRNTGQDN